MTRRNHCSKEFKLDAVSLELAQNYSQAEAAQHLGIPTTLTKPLDKRS